MTPLSDPGSSDQPSPATWSGEAFGLQLDSDFPVLGLEPGPSDGGERRTSLRAQTAASLDATWPRGEAIRMLERRYADGRLGMSVEFDEGLGYQVDAPEFGTYRITGDGSLIECAVPPGPAWRWQRPLFAQALPLAATLQGLELFHASAVGLDGRAVAFVGHSGAGKTSLAVHIAARGAHLLTDDVLALETVAGGISAHRGVRMANIAGEQLAAIGSNGSRLGRVLGTSDKVHVAIEGAVDATLPLAAVYFLERGPHVAALSFEPIAPPDPRYLLAATFMPHIATPARLITQLDVCAAASHSVAAFKLLVPESLGAPRLAEAVEAHARAAY